MTRGKTRGDAIARQDGQGRADFVGFDTDGTYVATFDRQTRFLYDRAGSRVIRTISDSGGITRTVYAGDCYEHTSDGASSETTKYYTLGGRRVGLLRLRAKPPLRFLRGLSPTARLLLGQVRSRRLGFTQTAADDSESNFISGLLSFRNRFPLLQSLVLRTQLDDDLLLRLNERDQLCSVGCL